MKNQIPRLEQFDYTALEAVSLDAPSGSELSFQVEAIPARITQRVLVGLFHEKLKRGIAVAFFPATGEVCDLMSDGGVIGYLSNVPIIPGDPVACELKMSRFGKNIVCSVRIGGELFLYPAFVAAEEGTAFTAAVGQEEDGSNAMIGWFGAHIVVNGQSAPVAA